MTQTLALARTLRVKGPLDNDYLILMDTENIRYWLWMEISLAIHLFPIHKNYISVLLVLLKILSNPILYKLIKLLLLHILHISGPLNKIRGPSTFIVYCFLRSIVILNMCCCITCIFDGGNFLFVIC